MVFVEHRQRQRRLRAGARRARTAPIIAATKTDGEKNQTRFGEYFTAAFALADADADTDKDGRVSALEAFLWARARTADSYKRDGQLLTEHAVLDDNGDGKGADAPGQPGSDGALARTFFLSAAGTRPVGRPGRPGAAGARRAARRARGEDRRAEGREGQDRAGRSTSGNSSSC